MNKVTRESIEKKIQFLDCRKLTDKLTHCVITLKNGFQVTGESACVDPKNFDINTGKELAEKAAIEKIWELEGYLLQEKLYLKKCFEERNPDSQIAPDEALNYQAVDMSLQENFAKILFGKNQYPVRPDEAFRWDIEEKKKLDGTYAKQESKAGIESLNKEEAFKFNREEKPFDWSYFCGMIEDPVFKEIAFYKLFPGVTKAAFNTLEKRREIRDELSFMEQYAELLQEKAEKIGTGVSQDESEEFAIKFNKLIRKEVDYIIQSLKGSDRKSPERSTAIRKFIEGVMWIGMDLKAMGTPNPYPESRNPNNTVVEPTADGLKL